MKQLLPVKLRKHLRQIRFKWRAHQTLCHIFVYDYRQYRSSSPLGYNFEEQEQLRGLLAIDVHKLEKGMALPQPRPGFGADTIRRLSKTLAQYMDRYGEDDVTAWAAATLRAYCVYHADLDVDVTWVVAILERIESQTQIIAHADGGGILETEMAPPTLGSFAPFARSRHSARIYTNDPVDSEKLRRAVTIAQTAPSVCNRQSGRVYFFRDPSVKKALLAAQGGSRGFGDTADVIAVISSDRRSFQTAAERNQCWIDGGLFAMTFLYGLHDEGLGACCLNWSRGIDDDRTAHRIGDIPDHEAIIMMIAIGNVPEKTRVARSPRRPMSSVLTDPA